MNPMDRLKQDLQDGPLTRNGFNDQLRGRIEKRLGEEKAAGRRRPVWFGRAASGLVILVLLVAALWQLPGTIEHNRMTGEMEGAGQAADLSNATMAADAGVNSAVLIGLRQDHSEAGRPFSTYRTILFAPEDEEMRKIAEGPGLLVPYGTKFWRVETGGSGMLTMRPADSKELKTEAGAEAGAADEGSSGVYEKVLFAGNKYVAVQQTVTTTGGVRSQAWVKEMKQLQAVRNMRLAGTPEEPHVALMAEGDEPAAVDESDGKEGARIENWTVMREPGAWVVAGVEGGENGRLQTKVLPNRPGWDIVNDDFLSVSWDAVKAVQPAAADVFSSKLGDVAAVVTDRNLVVYAVKAGELTAPEVTVPLQPGEQVVMTQWALNQPNRNQYVDIWKDVAGPLLGGGEPAGK